MYQPYGIIPPIITPFSPDGSINLPMLKQMSFHLIEQGIHGLFPFGTTGEFYAVGDKEYGRALEAVRDAATGRKNCYGKPIQLIAGCSHITTRETIRLTKLAASVGGYDAVSVLTPMFISQTQEELYSYFRTISEHSPLPVIMYNNKPKTNITITPSTVARLARDCPNIIGVKDSTGDMTNCEEYLRLTMENRERFQIMMGRDTMILAGLHYGCSGAVASCANVAPRICADIYDKFIAGDYAGALTAQYRLAPLRIACSMGTFPEVIKESLALQGMDVGKCLEPIGPLAPQEREHLVQTLRELGLI